MTIVDLSECVIFYGTDIESDTTSSHRIFTPISHSNKEKWVVILDTEAPNANNDELVDSNFGSTTTIYTKLHVGKYI